jgi:HEAT repeat protein
LEILHRHAFEVDDLDTRRALIRGLKVKTIPPDIAIDLWKRLDTEHDDEVRFSIADALSVIAKKSDSSRILDILQKSPSDSAISPLVIPAARLSGLQAIPTLRMLLKSRSPHVVSEAVVALARLKHTESLEIIRSLASHESPGVRESAREAVRKLEKLVE